MSYQQACKTADDSQQRRGVSSNGTPPANNYHQTPYQIFRNSTTINTSAANGVILGNCDDDQEDDICDIESIDLDSDSHSDGEDEEEDEDEGKENSIITTVVGKSKKKTQPATTVVALSPNSYKIRERARLLLMQQPGHNKTKRRLMSSIGGGDGGTNIKSDSSGGIVGTVKQSVNDGSSTTRELGGYHPQSSLSSAAGAASSSKPFSRGVMHNDDPMAMMMGSNYIPKRQSGPAMQQSSNTNQRKKSTLVNNKKSTLVNNNLVKINMPNGDRRVPLSNVSNKTANNKAKLKKNKRQPSSYSNNNNNDPIHALQRLHTDLSSNSKPNTIKRSDILAEEIEADLQEIASAFTHVVSDIGSKATKAVSVVNGGFEAVGNGFWQLWDE